MQYNIVSQFDDMTSCRLKQVNDYSRYVKYYYITSFSSML